MQQVSDFIINVSKENIKTKSDEDSYGEPRYYRLKIIHNDIIAPLMSLAIDNLRLVHYCEITLDDMIRIVMKTDWSAWHEAIRYTDTFEFYGTIMQYEYGTKIHYVSPILYSGTQPYKVAISEDIEERYIDIHSHPSMYHNSCLPSDADIKRRIGTYGKYALIVSYRGITIYETIYSYRYDASQQYYCGIIKWGYMGYNKLRRGCQYIYDIPHPNDIPPNQILEAMSKEF